jgi:hypothetical protein
MMYNALWSPQIVLMQVVGRFNNILASHGRPENTPGQY